jgi:hypothetical protein
MQRMHCLEWSTAKAEILRPEVKTSGGFLAGFDKNRGVIGGKDRRVSS